MTLNYNPEEKKSKYQVLLFPPDFTFGTFENFTIQFFENLAKSQNFGLTQFFKDLRINFFFTYQKKILKLPENILGKQICLKIFNNLA